MRRAAFLDRGAVVAQKIVRDGKPYAPTILEDFRLVSASVRQLMRLSIPLVKAVDVVLAHVEGQ